MRGAIPWLLAVVTATALADDWPGAQTREAFSQSREYFVRVVPGESFGDTVGFAGAKKGRYARAEFYRRGADRSYRLAAETALLNPVAPVEFFVADDGRLATLDNWHNLGYGKVLAVYDAAGRMVRAYDLRDLFAENEVAAFPRSVSSIRWRQGPSYVRPDQKTLLVTVKEGAELVLHLDSGKFQYCETREGRYRCR